MQVSSFECDYIKWEVPSQILCDWVFPGHSFYRFERDLQLQFSLKAVGCKRTTGQLLLEAKRAHGISSLLYMEIQPFIL